MDKMICPNVFKRYTPLLRLLFDESVNLESLCCKLINLQLINGPPLLQLVLLQNLLRLLRIAGWLDVSGERSYGLRQTLRDAHAVAEKGFHLLEGRRRRRKWGGGGRGGGQRGGGRLGEREGEQGMGESTGPKLHVETQRHESTREVEQSYA